MKLNVLVFLVSMQPFVPLKERAPIATDAAPIAIDALLGLVIDIQCIRELLKKGTQG